MAKNLKYLLLTKTVGFGLNVLAVFSPKKAAAIGYRLHSEPRIGKLKVGKLPAILENSEKNFFVANGLHYQTYTWAGNSETILLVHGWESNSSRWEQLLPFLISTGKTIVAIDAPAHGLSGGNTFSVPRYAQFIDAVCQKINPQYLVGHSIGGAACVFYQHKHQNANLKKMVIMGAPSDLEVLVNNFSALLSLNKKLRKHLTEEFSKQVSLPVADFSAIHFTSNISTKALIIHDVSDKIVSYDESQKFIKNWQNTTFISTENLGHSLHDDDLYQKIIDYLIE